MGDAKTLGAECCRGRHFLLARRWSVFVARGGAIAPDVLDPDIDDAALRPAPGKTAKEQLPLVPALGDDDEVLVSARGVCSCYYRRYPSQRWKNGAIPRST